MLQHLRIRNLAILEDVEIRLGPGLNLLTGETGAGKSIVVDALGLIMGRRADSDLLRTGADQAVVEAVFAFDGRSGIAAALADIGLSPEQDDDGTLIVRREVGPGGSRAFLNGSAATAGMLRQVAPWLADLHGQHQHQTLAREEGHLELLDAFAGAASLGAAVSADHAVLEALLARVRGIRERSKELEERLDLLRFRVEEFNSVDPGPGEDAELRRRRDLLAHAGEISGLLESSRLLLEESEEGSILSQVAGLHENLGRLVAFDPDLQAAADDVATARSLLDDLAATLRGRPSEVDYEPEELQAVEERLSLLAALARKHGGSLEAALEVRQAALGELEALKGDLEDPVVLQAETRTVAQRLSASAAKLSQRRRRKAGALQKAVEGELAELAMGGTRFVVSVEQQEETDSPVEVGGKAVRCDARGIDRVRFLLSANQGEEPRPLARIASGGELSRLMLALEGALRGGGGRTVLPGCLVFDEVDAGIGGRVAAVVGKKLQRLARERQVLCVTHLPQIASLAEAHFRVEKRVDAGRTRTRIRPLEGDARVTEIARMLAGSKVTRATRQHAAEMIGGSG